MNILRGLFIGLFLLASAVNPLLAEDSPETVKVDVQEFKLKNDMLFLVVERPATPQVACRIAIRAGSALEETGKTGIAHMLEHMMFKGTKNFGTIDIKRDLELQERIEAAYQVILEEKNKRYPNQDLIRAKVAEMDRLRQEVQKIYVPQALSSQLGRNGAVGVNAFTTTDLTQYKMALPSDMLEQWFSIISEQLFEPSLREFYVEKEVILRERASRQANNPGGIAWIDLMATAYRAHPYRNPIIGWKADIEKYSTRDAIEFHQKFYTPSNAVVVLVGDVTVEKAKKLAEIYFERYPAGKRAPEEVTTEPPSEGPRKSIHFLKGARTPLIWLGFHTTPMTTEDFYALDAMIMVLSSGRGARLTQNIVNKGLALRAWAGNPDTRYGGMVAMGGSPNEPKELKGDGLIETERRQAYLRASEDLEKLLLQEVEKLKTEPVSPRELARIKKLNQRGFLERMRSNEHLAGTLATLEVQVGWRYMKTYLDNLTAVTPEDIKRVAKKYIRRDQRTSVYVIPGGDSEEPPESYTEARSISGAAATKVFKPNNFANHSLYESPKGWKHPLSFERKPHKIEYPEAETDLVGTTKVFYLPDRELPFIDLSILIKAGAVDVDDNKTGLTRLLNGSLIRGGTDKYSPAELAMVLDENAIKLSVSVGEELSVIELSVMKEDWEKGMTIMEEVILRPRFDPGVFKVAKARGLTGLQRQGGNAQRVARREGIIWHFKGHPYGRDPLQGLKTIPTITRDDLYHFLRTYFVPSNMVVSVAGDIEKDQVMEDVGNFLKAFDERKVPERKLKKPVENPPVLAFIHKPGQVQSQISLTLRSIKRTHPDFWKMGLLMNIFGGSDSLLYTRLREDLGLVYGAWFFQSYKWEAGFLVGQIGCKGDKTVEAIRETTQIMSALRSEVPRGDLEQKRLDTLNSFIFNVDTPAALVEVYGRYYLRNEPLDTLEKIQEAYMSATKEELEALAKRLLDPSQLQIFVVGDKMTSVGKREGAVVTLEEDLKTLAKELGLPFREVPLR
jgi:predicted Zn-dependent peptidase